MVDLLQLEPQRINEGMDGKYVLLYGKPGCGKTSTASLFPKALIFGFEQGTNGLDNTYVLPIQSWSEWKSYQKMLLSKREELLQKFQTIVIDTADNAWEMCVTYICNLNGVSSLKEIPWGDGYAQAKAEYKRTFSELTYSSVKNGKVTNGYGLVFTSHETEKTDLNEKGEEVVKIVPALQTRPFEVVNKMVDIIGYIREIPTPIPNSDEVEQKRYIFLRGTDRFLAKSRIEYIEPRVELSYNNLAEAVRKAVVKKRQLESSGEAIQTTIEQNPYTVRSYESLMEEAKKIWITLEAPEKEKVKEILSKIFGKKTAFSDILPEERDKLEEALNKVKEILDR